MGAVLLVGVVFLSPAAPPAPPFSKPPSSPPCCPWFYASRWLTKQEAGRQLPVVGPVRRILSLPKVPLFEKPRSFPSSFRSPASVRTRPHPFDRYALPAASSPVAPRFVVLACPVCFFDLPQCMFFPPSRSGSCSPTKRGATPGRHGCAFLTTRDATTTGTRRQRKAPTASLSRLEGKFLRAHHQLLSSRVEAFSGCRNSWDIFSL